LAALCIKSRWLATSAYLERPTCDYGDTFGEAIGEKASEIHRISDCIGAINGDNER